MGRNAEDRKTFKELKKLYRQIPTFKCREGCTDCCGLVPFSQVELERIPKKREPMGLSCPYIGSGGCSIYGQRPFICRLFGASTDERIKCQHGCAPDVPLTPGEAAELMKQYLELTHSHERKDIRVIHKLPD